MSNTKFTNESVEVIVAKRCYTSHYGPNSTPDDPCRDRHCSCEGKGVEIELEGKLWLCDCGSLCTDDLGDDNADGSVTLVCSYCEARHGETVTIYEEDSDLSDFIYASKDVLLVTTMEIKKKVALSA